MARAAADALRLFRRDRDLITRVAAMFLFLPRFALSLLVPAAPVMAAPMTDEPAMQAWIRASFDWYASNGLGFAAAYLMMLFGSLTILTLYLDPVRPTLDLALRGAGRRLPVYLATALMVAVPVQLGLALLILPGLYLQGRLLLAGPALVADRQGPLAAVRASWRRTQRQSLALAAVAAIALFGGDLLGAPFEGLGQALDGAPAANPVVAALLSAAAAAVFAAVALATILLRIVLHQRLSGASARIG